jgi:hypothetical protein
MAKSSDYEKYMVYGSDIKEYENMEIAKGQTKMFIICKSIKTISFADFNKSGKIVCNKTYKSEEAN